MSKITNPYQCPLCQGSGEISQEQYDAIKVGHAVAHIDLEHITEEFGKFLGDVIGDQVAIVLSEYTVALVRSGGTH